jgi:hypothetical protein
MNKRIIFCALVAAMTLSCVSAALAQDSWRP